MKKNLSIIGLLLVFTTVFTSCLQDDESNSTGDYLALATVMVNPNNHGDFDLILDDSTILAVKEIAFSGYMPVNNQRVLASFSKMKFQSNPSAQIDIKLYHMDFLLSKPIIKLMNKAMDDTLGNDELYKPVVWVSGKYLNVNFVVYQSGTVNHIINLVSDSLDIDYNKPVDLALRYNRKNDSYLAGGSTTVVSFDLSSIKKADRDSLILNVKIPTNDGILNKSLVYKYK